MTTTVVVVVVVVVTIIIIIIIICPVGSAITDEWLRTSNVTNYWFYPLKQHVAFR
jgi:hypothetical protein